MLVGDKDKEDTSSNNDDNNADDSEEDHSDESSDDDENDSSDDQEGDEEEDSEEEDTDEDDEEDSSQFVDPKKLPKELRPAFKKMQAAFTKKMQGVSDLRRKAQALDQLAANPDFIAWAESMKRGKGKQPVKKSSDTSDKKGGVDMEALRAMIREEVGPIKAEQEKTKLSSELRQFKKDYPDWKDYKGRMRSVLRRNPEMSYEDAYKIASHSNLKRKAGRFQEDKDKQREDADVERPNSKSPDKKGDRQPANILEAYNLAKKESNSNKSRGSLL